MVRGERMVTGDDEGCVWFGCVCVCVCGGG